MSPRLDLALSGGGLVLPETGRVVLLHPPADDPPADLPPDRVLVVQPLMPDHARWAARGYECVPEVPRDRRFAAAIVTVPRAKARARALIAAAMCRTDGPVVIDGAKTDGIDGLWREVRARVPLAGTLSKAHGRIFWTLGDAAAFADWAAAAHQTPEGFVTAPGVFSADGIDPASALLAEALPAHPGAHVVDLGAGWGFLSAQILSDARLRRLDLVEADHAALNCARRNVDDPRARFHWADARAWRPQEAPQAVVMNPPFHTGRSADPSLGRDFIAAAAGMLAPTGSLWMVANRHLPYETSLKDRFAEVAEIAGDGRFKILRADRPRRNRPCASPRKE